jgi:hypothetical protein
MIRIIALVLLMPITACSYGGFVGDAVTTHAITESPKLVESNPIIRGLGGDTPLGNAAASIAVKVVANEALKPAFKNHPKYAPDTGTVLIDSTGWGATCWNLGMLATLGEPISGVAGLGCFAISMMFHKNNPKFVRAPEGSEKYWEKK